MKNTRKKNRAKRVHAGIKGLIITWADKNPLRDTTEIIDGKVSHRNPVYRLCAKDVWSGYGEFITYQQPLRWLVTITNVFSYPNGADQYVPVELEAYATISQINDTALEQIKALMRHGAPEHYHHTEFEIECIGVNP